MYFVQANIHWIVFFQNCCTIPYEFTIKENEAGYTVIGEVEATDIDIGDDANIRYYIIGMTYFVWIFKD